MILHRLRHLALLVIAAAFCRSAAAQTTVAAPVNGAAAERLELAPSKLAPSELAPPEFRRVYIPSGLVGQYADDQLRRWPVQRSEFFRLLRENQQGRDARTYGAPRVASIELDARFATSGELVGEASLHIVGADAAAQILNLEPLDLNLHQADWADRAEEALLGRWQRPSRPPCLGVLTPQPGTLRLDWSLAAETAGATELRYRLQLPGAVSRRLSLELPASYRADIDNGRLLQTAWTQGELTRRWEFQLGGGPCALRVATGSKGATSTPSGSTVSMEENYQLDAGGLDYDAVATIFRTSATDAVEFQVAGDLTIVDASVVGAESSWTLEGDATPRLRVDSTTSQNPLRIRIRGAARWLPDSQRTLPRTIPADAAWTDGSFALRLSPRTELHALQCRECVVVERDADGDAGMGEAIVIHATSAAASVNVEVGARQSKQYGRIATAASLDRSEVLATSKIEFWSTHGDQRSLQFDVLPNWTIESVDGPDVEDWFLSRVDREVVLRVTLNRAPGSMEPTIVTLIGRAAAQEFVPEARIQSLEWLRPSDLTIDARLLQFEESTGLQIVSTRDLVEAVCDQTALERGKHLLFDVDAGVVLDLSKAKSGARIRFQSAATQFDAETWTEVRGSGASIAQRIQVLATVSTGALREFTIAFTEPLPPSATWRIVGSDVKPAVTRLPGGSANAADSDALYRIVLPTSSKESIRLEAAYDIESDSAKAIAASAPDAANNVSWVVVRGEPASFQLVRGGAKPAAPAAPPGDDADASPVLGVFRVDDRAIDGAASLPVLQRRRDAEPSDIGPATYCSFRDATSWQFANGVQRNRVEYRLESFGGGSLSLAFPQVVAMESVQVANQDVAVEKVFGIDRALKIRLPAEPGPVVVCVEYSFDRGPLGVWALIDACLPSLSAAVLGGSWTLYAPSRYETLDPSGEGERNRSAPLPEDPGWTLASREFSVAPRSRRLVLRDTLAAAWWIIWFVVAAAAYAALRQWPARLFWGCLVVACVWLLLDANPRYIVGAVLVGAATALVLRWLLSSHQLWVGRARKMLGVAGIVSSFVHCVNVTNAVDEPAESTPPAVLFPIDGDLQPVGDDVFVPEQLLQRLWQGASPSPLGEGELVVTGAAHSLQLTRATPTGPVQCETLELEFRFRTLHPNVAARFELDRRRLRPHAEGTSLDGRPVELNWNEAGDRCWVRCWEVGSHLLRISASPAISANTDGLAELSLQLPRIPGTSVSVQWPSDILNPSINGRPALIESSRRLADESALGVDGELAVGWSETRPSSPAMEGAEELLWLDLRRDEATLTYSVRLPESEQAYRDLQLDLSPNLQLLPTSAESIVEEFEYFPDQGSRATVRVDPNLSGPIAFSLRFRLRRQSVHGVVELPTCRLSNAAGASRTLAVTIDAQLQGRIESELGMTRLDAEDLEQAAIALPRTPDVAYEIRDREPEWIVRVTPVAESQTLRQRTLITCSPDQATLTIEADWRDVNRPVWSHVADAPAGLKLQGATARSLSTGEEIPLDWALDESGRVNLFFRRGISQPHTVRVQGVVPYVDGAMPMPRVAFQGMSVTSDELMIYRTGSARVAWADPQRAPRAIEEAVNGGDARGRLFGRFELPRSFSNVSELLVTSNDPQYAAATLAVVDGSRGDDASIVHVAGSVRQGVVDRLRFSASNAWRDVSCTEQRTTVSPLGSGFDRGRQFYEVVLSRSYQPGETFQLTLAGSLAQESASGSAAVDLRLEDAAAVERFVAIRSHGAPTPWRLRGLRESAPPEAFWQMFRGAQQRSRFFRIVGDRFEVVRRDDRPAVHRAFVSLARMSAILNRDDAISCRAELTVHGANAGACVIRASRDARLLAVSSGGRLALAEPIDQRTWRLPLAPALLPQVVLIDYRVRRPTGSDLRLAPPSVMVDDKQLAVSKTVWQVRGGDGDLATNDPFAQAISQRTFLEIVADSHLADVSQSRLAYLQTPEWEADFWLARWKARIGRGLAELVPLGGDSQTLYRQWEELLASFSPPRATSAANVDEAMPLLQPATAQTAEDFWSVDRADGALRLHRPSGGPSWLVRILCACALAAIGVAAWIERAKLASAGGVIAGNSLAAGMVAGLFLATVFHAPLLGALLVGVALIVAGESRAAKSRAAAVSADPSRIFLQP